MAEQPLPLRNEPQPALDTLFPGHHFMTVITVETGAKKLVATRKSITLRPLYENMPVDDDAHIESYAGILVERLYAQYRQDRFRRLGRGMSKGGIGLVVGYHTPQEWAELKNRERLQKLNKLVKPKGGAKTK